MLKERRRYTKSRRQTQHVNTRGETAGVRNRRAACLRNNERERERGREGPQGELLSLPLNGAVVTDNAAHPRLVPGAAAGLNSTAAQHGKSLIEIKTFTQSSPHTLPRCDTVKRSRRSRIKTPPSRFSQPPTPQVLFFPPFVQLNPIRPISSHHQVSSGRDSGLSRWFPRHLASQSDTVNRKPGSLARTSCVLWNAVEDANTLKA